LSVKRTGKLLIFFIDLLYQIKVVLSTKNPLCNIDVSFKIHRVFPRNFLAFDIAAGMTELGTRFRPLGYWTSSLLLY